jgi:hypothetical protein
VISSTTSGRLYRAARWSVLAAVAGTLALTPMSGANASAAAVTAHGIKLPVSSVGAVIDVNNQLWVSDPSDSVVDVFSTAGTLLHKIIDLPGAYGLTKDPDGVSVDVAESSASAIAQVSTSSYTVAGSVTTDTCPWSLAWVNSRLAYSWGCQPDQDTAGVASLASFSSAPVELLSNQYTPPRLAAAGTTLAVADIGLDPGDVSTYTVASDGTYTTLASISPPESADVAFMPNGTSLVTAAYSDSAGVAFNPNTGAQQIAYPGPGSTRSVAVSPNGRYVATGFSGFSTTINLVDTTTDSVVWTRAMTGGAADSGSFAEMLPGSITFSPDSTEVFGVGSFAPEPGLYLFASDIHPTASHVAVKVPEVPAGHKLVATVTGSAGEHVALTAQATGGSAHSVGSVTVPSSGHTTFTFSSTFSGTLTATINGDAGHFPATAKTTYSVGSRSHATDLGGRKHHHVTYYTRLSQVRILLTTTPAGDATYSATPQELIGRHWRTGKTYTFHEVNGHGGVYFKEMQDNVRTRVKFVVKAGSASRGSHVTSGVFVLR